MENIWTRENYELSITRRCFTGVPYDAGWDGDPRQEIDGRTLQHDEQMRRLLELEFAIRPVPPWAQAVARQIDGFPPCGWCFPEAVEAICHNIGHCESQAECPSRCFNVGPYRLRLMADYAVCLEGWIEGLRPETVASELMTRSLDRRDWVIIAIGIWEALGEPTAPKLMLVRRLLARLRFWLQAPLSSTRLDDPARAARHKSLKIGMWDSLRRGGDSELVEMDARLRSRVQHTDRWLELIDATWPCAPKVFRFLERILVAIGRLDPLGTASPDELMSASEVAPILQADSTYLDSAASRRLYYTALWALGEFLDNSFPSQKVDKSLVDAGWGRMIRQAMGAPSSEKHWLAALLLKRIALFEQGFKTFHFARNTQQVR